MGRSMHSNILLAYELMGSYSLARALCFVSKLIRSSALILIGDTVSPSIIQWLIEQCSVRVYGVLGRYDNPAVASILRKNNGLIECKLLEINGLHVYGYGYTGCTPVLEDKFDIDVLVTSLCGAKYTCCVKKSDIVDALIDALRPRLVVTGSCRDPCRSEMVFSPGSLQGGYLGMMNITDNELKVYVENIDHLITRYIDK